jgi:PAS domain S-box-containing protein
MTDLSNYNLESLHRDAGLVLYRGRKKDGPGQVLVSLPEAESPGRGVLKRLEMEYRLRAELDRAWAIRPVDLIREKGQIALVLEDPGGEPLDQVLERPLEVTQFLRLAIGLSAALGALHERGIIHKDIKPANVMVDPKSSQVWLTGFGFALQLARARQTPEPPETIAGTLAYMAPEQTGRMNRSIDSRSDLYSLGMTFYEMLTGRLPFTASDPLGWVHCQVARQPMSPGERRQEIPQVLSSIILRLLAKTPEERYQTAAGLEADLRRCLSEWKSVEQIGPFSLGERDASERLVISEKLYGRDREREALLEAFNHVLSHDTPVFVLISGYSGVGKSSVVNELHQAIGLTQGIFISGKFDQYKRDIPYSTFAEAFQILVRQILGKNEAELGRWRNNICEAVGSNGQLIINLIPELELIIGKQPPLPELPAQEAQNRFHAVFRSFLCVFAQSEQPLALFLDDLQWLDPATLRLVEYLVTYPGVGHLLLIGAYRDNEVGITHPLALMLESIRKTKADVREIVLAPLSVADIGELIADTLHQERTRAEPLARLAHEKTGGNPFFTIQFLTTLATDGLLYFQRPQAAWHWDLAGIQEEHITENVVELLIGKLSRLPKSTREALKKLACMGSSAKKTDLIVVHGGAKTDARSDLLAAIRGGFIVQLSGSYKFAHDRIQEAAYSLIPERERAAMHLQIGRLLLSKAKSEELEEKVFEIVNQFNRGAGLLASRDERERVAELNLIAGQRAQASAAHTSALKYLSAGAALLAPDCWEHQHQLTFALEFQRATSEFLTGDLEATEDRLSRLSHHARSIVDIAAVTGLRVDLYTTLDRSDRAVDVGLEYLRRLGISWSPHPTEEEVLREYEEMWRELGGRSIEALLNLPPMIDADRRATMDVLTKVMPPAMFTDKNLQCLVLGRMARLSFEHGNSDGSCLGYVWLGGVLGSRFGDYQSGFRFGKLGVDLMEHRGLNRFKPRVYLGFGSLVNFWTQPLQTGFALMRRAFDAAQEVGDLTYAAYACYDLIGQILSSGQPLGEVQREAEIALELASNARFGLMIDGITSQLRLTRMLLGLTREFGSFDDDRFSEVRFERHLKRDPHLANPACRYWIRKLQGRLYAGNHKSAVEAAEGAERLLWAMPPSIELPDYHFHAALARSGRYVDAPPEERRRHLEALFAHDRQLSIWAKNCPANFASRAALVEAEIARIEGRHLDAERLYEEAIRSAHEHGFINDEAVANEIAGKFYLHRGLEKIGQTYLRVARSCYFQWGAEGKVEQLDRLYPLFEEAPLGLATKTRPLFEQMDQMAVIKALQAVSREIDLNKLIEKVMVIAVEWAGAERGLLFLGRGPKPRVAAEASTCLDKIQVILEQGFMTPPQFPESILRYVVRTRESVILPDASRTNSFSDDKYLQTQRSRSILCLPLVKQGIVSGELYLENNQVVGLFNRDRLTVLELLTSQAAISLENAQLYSELWEENSERIKVEEALRTSEERMNLAAEAANLGMWAWELANDDIWTTTKCRTLFGFKPNEPVDFRRFVDRVHAEDRKPILEALRRSLETRSEYDVEYRLAMPDGGTRWISTRGHPAFDAENNPVRVMGVSMDITAAKLSELQLLQQRDELAHLSRVTTIGQLATTLAHELNQPIGAIHTNAEAAEILLKKASPDLDEIRGIIGDIRRDGSRAGEVIHRMRALLQKHEFTPEPVDIKGLIEGVSELLHGTLISRKARLRIDLAPALPLVSGDPVHLQQVLLNLILNSLEAMIDCPPAERQVVVRATANSTPAVEVAVIDQGAGFIQWKLSKLFEPFSSTKKNGMGMGLAICHSIIGAHRGHITAQNNPDRGATVQFTLRPYDPNKKDSK